MRVKGRTAPPRPTKGYLDETSPDPYGVRRMQIWNGRPAIQELWKTTRRALGTD